MKTLYKLNNNGKPMFWQADYYNGKIYLEYGIINGKTTRECYDSVQKDIAKEVQSKYNEKIKQGYVFIEEIVDEHNPIPVKESMREWLAVHLPKNLSNNNNDTLLPMLAKTYNGNFWKYTSVGMAQYKINGLRCIIRAYRQNDIFAPYKLTFQSREGIYWKSLSNLENRLLAVLGENFINWLIDNEAALDGEIYLPNHSVNDINHFVKDPTSKENKDLQYWCYDLLIENMTAERRYETLFSNLEFAYKFFHDKNSHFNNSSTLVLLPSYEISTDEKAIEFRNDFINAGFEGLILRNPNVEYQFGRRRVGYMEKFKLANDGTFEIVDIIKEQKRDLPIIVCKNDINDARFETRFTYTHEQQKEILDNKDKYIGRYVDLKFGERSGVEKVPFHIKDVTIHYDVNGK